jgi:hypothetical protein
VLALRGCIGAPCLNSLFGAGCIDDMLKSEAMREEAKRRVDTSSDAAGDGNHGCGCVRGSWQLLFSLFFRHLFLWVAGSGGN